MNTEERPTMPKAQIIYGEIVYWATILAAIICMIGPLISMINVDNNVLNPHYLFAGIFEGKDAATIWKEVGGGFPGGHFYLSKFTSGDGFTQEGRKGMETAATMINTRMTTMIKAVPHRGCRVDFFLAFSTVKSSPASKV